MQDGHGGLLQDYLTCFPRLRESITVGSDDFDGLVAGSLEVYFHPKDAYLEVEEGFVSFQWQLDSAGWASHTAPQRVSIFSLVIRERAISSAPSNLESPALPMQYSELVELSDFTVTTIKPVTSL